MLLPSRKRVLSGFLIVVGALCVWAGSVLYVLEHNLFDATSFAKHAALSLSDPRVAAFASKAMTEGVVASRPDLIAVRPIILGIFSGLVTTRPFQALVETAAGHAHRAALSEGARRVILSLPDLELLLREALEQASPELAAKLPKQMQTLVAAAGQGKQMELLVDAWRLGGRLKQLWRVLLVVGPMLLAAGVWVAANRRRALERAGAALAGVGLLLVAVAPVGSMAMLAISDLDQRGLGQGLLATYLGELRTWGFTLAGLGVVLAAGAASLLEAVNPFVALQRAAELGATPPASLTGRLTWSLALLAVAATLVAFPLEVVQGTVVLAGLGAAFFGARELFRLFLQKVAHTAPQEESFEGLPWGFVAPLLLLVGTAAVFGFMFWRRTEPATVGTALQACNGMAELCDRRLDQVVFPGTHNAMSNQDISDWMFPHHQAGIPRQLRDGVRALLFDVHYGFPGASRIKTDLSAEPSMEKVKAAVGAEAYEAALRIRNRLVGVDQGKHEPYLCHGLCELGAYELSPLLMDIKKFLVANPDEVLMFIIEDYVEPRDLAAAFEKSGLAEFVYADAQGQQWPTLRDLIGRGKRLVVFIESGRPGVAWLRPAFASFRETPYSFHKREEFSCRANRGGDGGSLFLLNHWIETTPTPKPSNALMVNSYQPLLERAQTCWQERGHIPNVVAVDFYRSGDLIKVVQELNRNALSKESNGDGN